MTSMIHCPRPQRSLKRKLSSLDEQGPFDINKRQRFERSVLHWLSEIPQEPPQPRQTRSLSAPPAFIAASTVNAAVEIGHMSQQPVIFSPSGKAPAPAPSIYQSVASTKTKTDDPSYPQNLYNNGVIMDRSGRRIPADIKAFVDEHILNKQRLSPPLAQTELDRVIKAAELVADSCEGAVYNIIDTKMFPLDEIGISSGGDIMFSQEPIPSHPDAFYELAIPKPDRFYGYTTGQNGDFTRDQNYVLSHPFMKKYAQPTSDSAFPFLIMEVKSEAKGGTLWHAENQAAGSGSHCVNGMRWLRQHAVIVEMEDSAAGDSGSTKTIAFSICLTARQVLLYVHSYSTERNEHMMSNISTFVPTKAKDIQECRNYIKNIIDFALKERKDDVGKALDTLYPYPQSWLQKRLKQTARGSAISTPATSFTGQLIGKAE